MSYREILRTGVGFDGVASIQKIPLKNHLEILLWALW
jgi:hypothetical protein